MRRHATVCIMELAAAPTSIPLQIGEICDGKTIMLLQWAKMRYGA